MRVTFWGVRGSIPAPGPETNRYGGNTSCVSVTTEQGELIIIDMGTGVTKLGEQLLPGPFGKGEGQATILLSHSHWDHIQGFPFFPPVFIPGNRFVLHGNAKSASMLEGILEGQMNPHFSPIYTLKNLGAAIEFRAVTLGEYFEVGSLRVRARLNPHGGTTALAFRLEEGERSFVYASDVCYPLSGPSPEILDLYRGADVLLHDSTYTPEDQEPRRNRGFSSYVDAAAVAVAAEVKHLVMFHYDQDYSDDMVDALRDSCRAELDRHGGQSIELTAAAEGTSIEL
jgi:phosphoribosyl 1,2-cyclic phosphodiesterase